MKAPEDYRIKSGPFGTTVEDGNNGYFIIPFEGRDLSVIASDGMGWEHVSVSLTNRTPNWKEMCLVKSLFWDEEECVIEYHPPKSEYVNNHPFCLHLWKEVGKEFKRPPAILLGFKT